MKFTNNFESWKKHVQEVGNRGETIKKFRIPSKKTRKRNLAKQNVINSSIVLLFGHRIRWLYSEQEGYQGYDTTSDSGAAVQES